MDGRRFGAVSPDFDSSLVGQTIGGFHLTHLLGSGAMATVYRGENTLSTGIVRALKVVRPELTARPEFVQRFVEEARTLERLEHRNIVRFYGVRQLEFQGRTLFAMELEYLEGNSLAKIREARDAKTAVAWLAQACEGVAVAHGLGVVHRDLKPDNLLLTRDNVVKVLDFGLARAFDDAGRASNLTVAGSVPGTPAYMAPEVCNGALPSAAADVYALGITGLELVLGYHPFIEAGQAPQSATQLMFAHVSRPLPRLAAVRPDVPRPLDEVLTRATAKDPLQRYKSAGELAAALRDALASPASAAPSNLTQFAVPTLAGMSAGAPGAPANTQHAVAASPAKTGARPTALLAAAGVLLTLLLVAGGLFAFYQSSMAQREAALEAKLQKERQQLLEQQLMQERELRATLEKRDAPQAQPAQAAPPVPQPEASTRATRQPRMAKPPAAPSGGLTAEERELLRRMGANGTTSGQAAVAPPSGGPSLTPQQLIAVVQGNKTQLQRCYETSLRAAGGQQDGDIKITVAVTVGESGTAKSVDTLGTGLGNMTDCIKSAVKRWRFPSSGGESEFQFPLVFQPGA